jgi:hypothetical protein
MKEKPVIWAVLKTDALQLHPLRGLPSMAGNILTFQTILFQICKQLKLWNKQV